MSLSVEDRRIVYYALIAPCCLSILGCGFILGMYASFRSLRSLPFKMISILSVFDLMNAVAFLIPTYEVRDQSSSCLTQGILLNFSSLASIVWTTFMAIYLYSTIKSLKSPQENSVWLSLGLVIILSITDTILPLIVMNKNAYGKTKGWCWIEDKYPVLRYSLFFIPLALIILLNFCVYLKVKKILSQMLQNETSDSKAVKKIKNKLLLYPIILILCYFPYSLKALLEVTMPDMPEDYIFTLISVIFRSLHGFFNFLIYGLTTAVQKKLKSCFAPKLDSSLYSLKVQITL